MKILYVTGMSPPMRDILTGKTENEITGLPGFFYPWYKLVERGHQVDFIQLSNFNQEVEIKVDWFKKDNLYVNIYDPYSEAPWYRRIVRRIKRFLKLLYYTNKALSENNYDFVYCTAYYEGLAGNIVANIKGVPCGMRSMGTMLYYDFEKYGYILTAFLRPVEFISFKMRKEFLLMTDDGTKGDLVYDKWKAGRQNYDFHFWKTGVEFKDIDKLEDKIVPPKHEYIFFAARFDNWKRHDRILEILRKLHERKKHIHLYFAGNVQSESYQKHIRNLVGTYDLEKYVHFLGPVKQDELAVYAYYAVANPLMYDHSNLGNVFFESFSGGSVIIGINDGSLSDYIENGINGFVVNDEDEACSVIVNLLDDRGVAKTIRENAIKCARQKVLSIDERFDMEVELIEKSVASK